MRLTHKQYNIIQKIIKNTNNDEWFSIVQDKQENDFVLDKIKNKKMPLWVGIDKLDKKVDIVNCDFLTWFEKVNYLNLIYQLLIYPKHKAELVQQKVA